LDLADIILKNREGADVAYSGVEQVCFDTADAGQAVFSRGQAVAHRAQADFSGGDQVITPEAGQLFSALTVQKPETLRPENIAKDVNIAGVWGNYIGGHDVVSASGTFTATGTGPQVVTMNLGVIPDVIFVMAYRYNAGYLTHCFGVSSDLAEKIDFEPQPSMLYNTNPVQISGGSSIDAADSYGNGFISEATPASFKIGGSILKLYSGNTYYWYAMGGLLTHTGYFYIRTAMPDSRTLVITGGVPEIQQLEIYVDGVLGKTVPYIHGPEFTVDISDIADDYRPHTLSVKALGDGLDTEYSRQYYDSVSNGIRAGGKQTDTVKWSLYNDGLMRIHGTGAMDDYASADVVSTRPWDAYATQVTALRVEDGITRTGARCFFEFTSLKSAYIGETVALGTHLFYGCSSLTQFTLPPDITELPMSTFNGCSSLTQVTIPESVTSIGDYAFRACSSLTNITIPDGVTSIGESAFSGCTGLTQITIPENVTNIGPYAFRGCTGLTQITIPENVTNIGPYAFRDCSGITSIRIPANVTNIGTYAFYAQTGGLTSATFAATSTWKRYSSATATSGTTLSSTSLANTYTAATWLRSTYSAYNWRRT